MDKKKLTILGLMSGTSLDGIDISIVKTNGIDLENLDINFYYEYNTSYKNKIKRLFSSPNQYFLEKKFIDDLVTKEHFKALKNILNKYQVDLIGFHGQTILHDSEKKISIQAGNGQLLSNFTKNKVIFNFRHSDISNGGSGAPLAPIYHQFLINNFKIPLPSCFVNIGGVANLTYWDGNKLIGFDTGPGNCLIDDYVKENLNKSFDKNGLIASKGLCSKKLLNLLLDNKYFSTNYPKSIDRNHFHIIFDVINKQDLSIKDTLNTLVHFTINSIFRGIQILPQKPKNILVSGGGAKNTFLMSVMKTKLIEQNINLIHGYINEDFIESELIAYLAARSFYNLPLTFSSTTGVKKPVSGGELFSPHKNP